MAGYLGQPAVVLGPPPTTVSHDGGCADRPRTRMSRCTPTGLSHATGHVDHSNPRRPMRGGETLSDDRFVPKQPGYPHDLQSHQG